MELGMALSFRVFPPGIAWIPPPLSMSDATRPMVAVLEFCHHIPAFFTHSFTLQKHIDSVKSFKNTEEKKMNFQNLHVNRKAIQL